MPKNDGFDWVFLGVWLAVLVFNLLFWAGLIALGFYAVNEFAN